MIFLHILIYLGSSVCIRSVLHVTKSNMSRLGSNMLLYNCHILQNDENEKFSFVNVYDMFFLLNMSKELEVQSDNTKWIMMI